MATKIPAKSILKTQIPGAKPTLSDEQKAKAEQDRRNLRIALRHANRIQYQKDVQSQVLSNIETLLEIPRGTTSTPSEALKFSSLVQFFQPSDFDSLVEERRIDGKCGYALCSEAPRAVTLGSSAAWKLKGKGAAHYCNNGCLRKALYVKTQLSEVPSWERELDQQVEIVLPEDDRPAGPPSHSAAAQRVQERVANEHDLALERGETAASFKPGQVMASSIVEKPTGFSMSPNLGSQSQSSYTAIEGYEPRKKTKRGTESTQPGDDDDEDDYVGNVTAENAGDEESEAWRELFKNVDRP